MYSPITFHHINIYEKYHILTLLSGNKYNKRHISMDLCGTGSGPYLPPLIHTSETNTSHQPQ